MSTDALQQRKKKSVDPSRSQPVEESSTGGPLSIPGARVAEERAAKILERAAALDAKRSGEIEVDQLREAAADAGISREAFDQALREQAGGTPSLGASAARGASLAPHAGLLRDLLGDDGQVAVAGDRIEWRDDAGLVVSLGNGPGGMVAAVSAEGRRRTRYLGVILGVLIPWLISFVVLAADGSDEAFLAFFGMTIGVVAALVGTEVAYRIERKALRKKAESIRRQLQLVLPPDRSNP